MGNRGVGVAGFGDFEGAIVQHQPSPAAAELGCCGLFELGHEVLETAEVSGDFVGQRAGGSATAIGLDRVPVKAVVPSLSRIVEQTGFASVTRDRFDHGFDRLAIEVGVFDGVVVVIDVGRVVLIVVELQRFLGDVRRQCRVVKGQCWQFVGHAVCSLEQVVFT